jgi:hypothetical protein
MADPAIEEESNIVEDNKTANAIASMLWCWKYVNRDVVSSGSSGTITSDSVAIERGDFTKVPVGSFLKPGGPTITNNITSYTYFIVDNVAQAPAGPTILNSNLKPIPDGYASIVKSFNPAQSFTPWSDAILYKNELETKLAANGIDSFVFPGSHTSTLSIDYRLNPVTIISAESPLLNFTNRDVFYLASKPPQYYLRFGALLQYIKDELLPKIDTNKPKHYENPPIFDINYGQYSNFMYSLPNQISLDPKVCIVKNLKFQKIPSTVQVFTNLEPFLVEDFNPSTTLKNQAYTMNIYLNFEFILESLNSNVDERGDISVYNFLKVVCDGLNKSLGGINNLEPTIDEETNTLTITETTPIPGRIKGGSYFLQLYGYKGTQSTFVRKVDLKTAITPEYATMITIGATAGGYVKGTEATAFSRWNKGLIDRFQEKYIPGNENSLPEGGLDEAVTNYTTEMLSKVSLCYGFTGNLYGAPPELGGLSEDAIATNLSVGTEYYKYLVASNKNQQGGTVGFIPFKISFTMDGISGIKIYNVLHVDTRFLPKAYGDNVDLIVTGVTHKLSDNDWQTDIEATVMPKTSNLASIVIDPSVIAESIKLTPPITTPPTLPPTISGTPGTSGYGETIGTCGTPYSAPTSIITQNTTANQAKAEKLIKKIISKLSPSSGHGACAKFVKNIVDAYWSNYLNAGKNISTISTVSVVGGKWGNSPADAKTKSVHDYIVSSLGYTRYQVGKNLSNAQARSLASSFTPNIGDIMAYWDHSANTKSHQKYGHIQIYKGGGKWHSDFSHSPFVYSYQGCWDVIYLKSPDKLILIKD